MRSHLILAAASLAVASPAPQAFDVNLFNNIPNNAPQGPPAGVVSNKAYDDTKAVVDAAAKASGPATAQLAKKSAMPDLERRWGSSWNNWNCALPPANEPSTNMAPSSCTPVSWTNTFAFTAAPGCATDIEVGTYCGFINPEDPCAAQPNAYGPHVTPDTADAFQNDAALHELAISAKTPSGYTKAFTDLSASVSGSGYLGYYELTAYDPATCAAKCESTKSCTGFNVFIERDPQFNPRQCSCTSPPSVTRFKCSLWGQDVTTQSATNTGQDQDGFQVIIIGSNGYNKQTYTPPNPPSCSRPQSCGTGLINQQPYCMGQTTIPGPFNPSLCAAYAQKQNQVNRQTGLMGTFLSMFGMNKGGCVQFQAAYLEKGGVGFGTHCRLFTKKFAPSNVNLDIKVSTNSQWGCQKSYLWDVDVNADFTWGR
ncbi:uncharacterized protein SETTUDRAFT_136615 [Exserohilum turcica Et28A]|uniref:Uncharacterized protein n=1 Tax=Exserohilum turcicum (strain 28A) TaxID=671987 RepID=R0K577_EXST2|nr:uncharacterized protein SETTUDRAFT_136615 [Exserohilum turcica Et28A]EOA84654.1 hypothetical protein SETTUDRAFT_136615 [Exserohilum turcica Et28A]